VLYFLVYEIEGRGQTDPEHDLLEAGIFFH
jgi:hypothetical protein